METHIETQKNLCPICKNTLEYYTPRYPKAICGNCSNNESNIFDSDGNNVCFANVDITGGFISIHNINGKQIQKSDHECWISGIKCYADEFRFGGIVIQVAE